MILNEAQPEKSLYVVGALLIESLSQRIGTFSVTELYAAEQRQLQVSFAQFILAIDWLFLTGAIAPANDGRLKKCF